MTPNPTYVPSFVATTESFWIILAALLGAAGALASQFLAESLTRGRELKNFRIESFERFRTELWEDPDLKVIRRKYSREPLTDDQMLDYLGFWEEVGIYDSKRLIDAELLDEVLGDYVIDCYNDAEIRKYIAEFRVAQRDDSYFEFFERLARKLIQARQKK